MGSTATLRWRSRGGLARKLNYMWGELPHLLRTSNAYQVDEWKLPPAYLRVVLPLRLNLGPTKRFLRRLGSPDP